MFGFAYLSVKSLGTSSHCQLLRYGFCFLKIIKSPVKSGLAWFSNRGSRSSSRSPSAENSDSEREKVMEVSAAVRGRQESRGVTSLERVTATGLSRHGNCWRGRVTFGPPFGVTATNPPASTLLTAGGRAPGGVRGGEGGPLLLTDRCRRCTAESLLVVIGAGVNGSGLLCGS